MATRLPASQRTREELTALIEGPDGNLAAARPHPIALNSFLSKDTAGSSWTKSMSVA